eukprot:CAMPEP_0173135800 /NCGR_PEP_ID=MMETSP1105-20130129/2106_1 /TAXON_ID=2985 /ORGANISM="Ochromonas sp., Strain BG-1" /LENGTH=55 /DNA_ID=CAMNT_0014047865 /DNA_START=69 /DNA_END=233 /DNA_ORIENTATION=+
MIEKYPYLSEPRVFIASTLAKNEQSQGHTRESLAKEGQTRIEEWGMLAVKTGEIG